ncbi:antitoxin VbhA family protein [Bacillus sp. MYb209]|uniref:antitoxin VbhA family protein n=1 Tax=Bacillus sp. MYb209 TaxID=1848605 RepID=UPI0015E37695|nr:antitoxin VbhA family protein [Bacillus sp. MYb209]
MFKNEIELHKAFEEAKASFAIEGLTVTKEMEKIMKDKLRGNITMEEFIKLADAIARRQ